METKHTPGPWVSRTDTVETNDGRTICDVRHAGTWATDANARLIAAAPELLAALRMYVEGHGTVTGRWLELALAALAKAGTPA